MRLPLKTATYCFSSPSIPVKSTSGTRGTWYTFSGTFTLTLAPILAESPSEPSPSPDTDGESPSADEEEEDNGFESDFSATSQETFHFLDREAFTAMFAAVVLGRGERRREARADLIESDGDKEEEMICVLGRLMAAAATAADPAVAGESRAMFAVIAVAVS